MDKYSNPAQEIRITPTLINGVKRRKYNTGQINVEGSPWDFRDNTLDFISLGVTTQDRLIVLVDSDRQHQSYLGNWSINEIATNTFNFDEIYSGTTTTGLDYIIGDDSRVLGDDIYLAHIVDPADTYLTNASGVLEVEVCFDYPLAGHTVTLAAHTVNDDKRTGISTIKTLRWSDYTSSVEEIDNDGGTHNVYLRLGIGGPAPEYLMDVSILSSSFDIETEPHCTIDIGASDFHTDGNGVVNIVINTDGNTTATGGVDKCTVEWNKDPVSVLYEY